ncbi:hypothetical protein C0Q70_10529 [Pomacea canaliculata]|uniref:Uncharacterized protein n=1 Tax=Pomacea canaliculata TaxID=400727 RepID=A0A2T7P3I0_POMCA|nr:hypothetical protein C0Q70_10529 [Pomacea canaliculata]
MQTNDASINDSTSLSANGKSRTHVRRGTLSARAIPKSSSFVLAPDFVSSPGAQTRSQVHSSSPSQLKSSPVLRLGGRLHPGWRSRVSDDAHLSWKGAAASTIAPRYLSHSQHRDTGVSHRTRSGLASSSNKDGAARACSERTGDNR